MSIAIIDYGVGNLRSISNSFTHVARPLHYRVEILDRAEDLTRWNAVVLPGQGAFGSSMDNLRRSGWDRAILDAVAAQVPLFGICVGMQMLLDASEEMGCHEGLKLVPGQVKRFPERMADPLARDRHLRIPQIGWNQLRRRRADPLLAGLPDGAYAYFAHSYRCLPEDESVILACTEYGVSYASVLQTGHIWGIQCHPEKSQYVGLQILRNFMRMVERRRNARAEDALGGGQPTGAMEAGRAS